jgi:hypothetical protein
VKTYKQTVNGLEHTFQLSDEDAKARGLTSADQVEDAPVAESPLAFGEPTTDGQDTEASRKAAAAPKNKAAAADTTK